MKDKIASMCEEFESEFTGTLNAVAMEMTKHMSVHGVNAWAVFKNEDGTSVENLDLQKA